MCRAARRRSPEQVLHHHRRVTIPGDGAEGMIVTQGGRFGGYGLFMSKGVLGFERGGVVFLYNLLDLKRTIWTGLT